MAIKSTVRNWFLTGLKPTQTQFWAFFDAIWFKDEMIPVEKSEGIQDIYDAVNESVLLFNRSRIYLPGELQIFKRAGFVNAAALEVGDVVIGIIENAKIEGTYLGGNPRVLSSFNIINQIDF